MAEDAPRVTEVRAAAEALNAAIAAHLAAVEAKTGEQDPAVQNCYQALRAALSGYEDLLFDAYGEVTPFELAHAMEEEQFEVAPEHASNRLQVLSRSDYAITDVDRLGGIEELLAERGPAGLAAAPERHGLRALGATTWLVVGDPEPVDWREYAFDDVDPDRLIARYDEEAADD